MTTAIKAYQEFVKECKRAGMEVLEYWEWEFIRNLLIELENNPHPVTLI